MQKAGNICQQKGRGKEEQLPDWRSTGRGQDRWKAEVPDEP
jgi:hypothetical protein